MATTLSQLRKNKSNMLDKIVKDLDSGGKQFNNEEDKRFWKITRDKAGNGSAVIRFLPPVHDELPWVRVYSYGFKGPGGKWYINESPSTIGLPDPVMEYNGELYARGDEASKADAKKRSRRTQFISNIVVIKDPANPENEGKVFLFKYGKKILDMVTSKAKPEFDDEDPVQVWDLDEGANLKLRIKTVADYPNYDSSEWANQTALFDGDDDLMQKAIDACHKLNEFHDPKKFKSYEDLKKEFDRAMSTSATPTAASQASRESSDDNDPPFDLEAEVKKASTTQAKKVEKKVTQVDDDDELDEFKKLLEDI